MSQGRDARDVVQEAAIQALRNELELAIQLLCKIQDARETLKLEAEAMESARQAFRHASEALTRIPTLSELDMRKVQDLMDAFRDALAELSH